MHGSPKDELPLKASDVETVTSSTPSEPTSLEYCIKLMFCVFGLQVAYITWGVLQVREVSCVLTCDPLLVCVLFF